MAPLGSGAPLRLAFFIMRWSNVSITFCICGFSWFRPTKLANRSVGLSTSKSKGLTSGTDLESKLWTAILESSGKYSKSMKNAYQAKHTNKLLLINRVIFVSSRPGNNKVTAYKNCPHLDFDVIKFYTNNIYTLRELDQDLIFHLTSAVS